MQFDEDENLIVASRAWASMASSQAARCSRSPTRPIAPGTSSTTTRRLRMADDLDIAPDGKIYFSDCTTRYEMTTNSARHPRRATERPPGRLRSRDQEDLHRINHFYFPNGICVSHDGKSILIASTSLCKIFRYWIAGPRKGELEVLIDELPGQSRQHQPRLGRQLLAGAGRHPHADLRPRHEESGLPAAHGQAGPDRRMAGARHEPWLRAEIQRNGEALESYWDPDRHLAFDADLDARAQGLSLSRRAGEQPHRPDQARSGDPSWTGYEAYWGNKRHDWV